MNTDILSAASLTLFVIAATREVRKRFPAVDGLLCWLAAGLIGVAASFVAAVLVGPVEWRAAVIRGLAFAVAAVGAVGTKKALVEPAPMAPEKPAAAPPAPADSASPTLPVAAPSEEVPAVAADLDFSKDPKPSNQ